MLSHEDTKKIVNDLLVDLFNYIINIESKWLASKGVKLTTNEIHVLENVEKLENATSSSLASKMYVTKGTITVIVNRLVNKGYIKRTVDDTDRRRFHLSITEKSEEVLKIHEEFHHKMVKKMTDQYKLQDDVLLVKSLQNLKDFFWSLDVNLK